MAQFCFRASSKDTFLKRGNRASKNVVLANLTKDAMLQDMAAAICSAAYMVIVKVINEMRKLRISQFISCSLILW